MPLRLRRFALWTGLVVSLALVTACEDEEANKIAQAQACLDRTDETAGDLADQAERCRSYVRGINTQQAWIIQCSVDFLKGGLTTTRIVNAYKELDGGGASSAQKETYFIGAMALSSTAVADAALESCKKSEVESLIFIASMSRTGTYINLALGGSPILNNDGTINDANLQNALADCASATPTSCNPTAIGESVLTLADVYCDGQNANAEVCTEVNKAITNGNGDPAQVGSLLSCLLQQTPGPACSSL